MLDARFPSTTPPPSQAWPYPVGRWSRLSWHVSRSRSPTSTSFQDPTRWQPPKTNPAGPLPGISPPPRPAVISRGTPWSPGSRFRVAPSHPPPLPCHCSSPFIRSPIYFSSFPLFLSPSSFSPHPFSSILLTRAERERERGVFVAWRLRRSSSTTGGQGRAVVTRSRSQTGLSAFLVVVAATAAITAARMVILRGVATRWLAMAGTSPTTALPQQYLSSSSSSSSLSSSFVCCCYVST